MGSIIVTLVRLCTNVVRIGISRTLLAKKHLEMMTRYPFFSVRLKMPQSRLSSRTKLIQNFEVSHGLYYMVQVYLTAKVKQILGQTM